MLNNSITSLDPSDFQIPPELEAAGPIEAAGARRDDVKLMVSWTDNEEITDSRFSQLGNFLSRGDLLVINTSSTISASMPISVSDGTPAELHLCSRLPGELWIVEICEPGGYFTTTFPKVVAGEKLVLPGGGTALIHTAYLPEQRSASTPPNTIRLWIATFDTPLSLFEYLDVYATPIRYSYVNKTWPISFYRTVYGNELGSSEMPSAGRAFTQELLEQLIAQGIQIAPLVLHTGVATVRNDEALYEEYYRIPLETAQLINASRQLGKRIIAVGTTVLRALETAIDINGVLHPAEGWTRLVITPDYQIRSVDGLVTGLHTARSTHISIMKSFAGEQHMLKAYNHALEKKYLWHEFGDTHLILRPL